MESSSELITLIAVGVGLMLLLAMAFILFFSFSQAKFRQQQFKAQDAKLAYQEELLHSNLLTQEQERARIAKDLHDEVGSKLNVIHLYLHRLKGITPSNESLVNELFSVINETIDTTRRISHDLLPPTLENFGLQVAIEELCEQLQNLHPANIHFDSEGERSGHIESEVELNLFRILQELLSNSFKYSHADHIYLYLGQFSEKLILRYTDDGVGFDPNDHKHQKGLGMKNIQSRLQMVNGAIDFSSTPGKGVHLKITVPLKRILTH